MKKQRPWCRRERLTVELLTLPGLLLANCLAPQPLVLENPGPRAAVATRSVEGAPLAARLPPSQMAVSTSNDLALLAAPPEEARFLALIREYFAAITEESISLLSQVLSEEANVRFVSSSGAVSAFGSWSRRFAQLDYSSLDAEQVFRASDVEIYSAEDVTLLSQVRTFRLKPEPGEWLVRFPVAWRETGTKPRFGTEMEFVVESTPEGLRIRSIYEDYTSP